jgi:general transcriptional corepressor CYC8
MTNGSHPNAANVSPGAGVSNVANGQLGPTQSTSAIHKLAQANEQTWLLIGSHVALSGATDANIHPLGRIAEQMGDLEHAQSAYESALRHNPISMSGLTQVAGIARIKENYPMVSPSVTLFPIWIRVFLVLLFSPFHPSSSLI